MARLIIGTDKARTIPVLEKGSTPTIDTLNVTPSTSAQTITASGGVDGYSPVNVAAVNASIDANIIPGNIKSGVSILGVNGNVIALNGQSRSVQLTSQGQQTFTPSSPYNALTSISVSPNNYYLQTITPTTFAQTYTIPSGYSGNGTVRINPVTYTIDNNIVAGNIKSGVTILGVTGNYTGTTPSGTTYIYSNGTHDVTNYSSAYVQITPSLMPKYITNNGDYYASSDGVSGYNQVTVRVPGGLSAGYTTNSNNKLISAPGVISTVGATDIGTANLLQNAFQNDLNVSSVNFDSLTEITADYACSGTFTGCTLLTSYSLSNLTRIMGTDTCRGMFDGSGLAGGVILPNLTTINGANAARSMFGNCANITSVSLPNLETVTGDSACRYMFGGCANISTIYVPKLQTVDAHGLQGFAQTNTTITSMTFPALSSINGTSCLRESFSGATSLTSISFPALTTTSFGSYTDQFYRMLRNVTGCTVHFPSNLQSVIGSWSDVTSGFGGTNTTVAFDLPATS